MVIQVLAGVSLVLFSIRFLTKGLARLGLDHLLDVRWACQHSGASAFFLGIVQALLVPSSTASTVRLRALLASEFGGDAGFLFFLGNGVGLTALPHCLTTSLANTLIPWLIAFGGGLFMLQNRESLRGVGQSALAFGFLFMSFQFMTAATSHLLQNPFWAFLFSGAHHASALVFLLAASTAFILQSSTSAIAIGLGFASGAGVSLSDPQDLIDWICGVSFGPMLWSFFFLRKLPDGGNLLRRVFLSRVFVFFAFTFLPVSLWVDLFTFCRSVSLGAVWLYTLFHLLTALIGIVWTLIFPQAPRHSKIIPFSLNPVLKEKENWPNSPEDVDVASNR